MFRTIVDTKDYSECMKYVEDLEYVYVGSKINQVIVENNIRIFKRFCKEREYYNNLSNSTNCSSVSCDGDVTLNTTIKSPVEPSLSNPFPLIIFSSIF